MLQHQSLARGKSTVEGVSRKGKVGLKGNNFQVTLGFPWTVSCHGHYGACTASDVEVMMLETVEGKV
jgi:hypothetical protein